MKGYTKFINITTAKTFVPKLDCNLPSPNVGFPYLSAAGLPIASNSANAPLSDK
ncbi:hypothetical protein [Sphingobacterium sp. HMA12]|uniref:hypothetical protein n=1 Tax=Sphingobacterium sp. HMA12 TaxID=2050894 RepID=UPI00131595A9|nr:hypothetical protein [Sphingobacterium sp. HMA12]